MAKQTYAVGRFTLEPRRQLLDCGRPVALGGKALDLLSVLAEAEGDLVTKDELMSAIWPDVVIEENAIQVHISALRKVLGDAAERIETVRGLGYRLVSSKVSAEKLTGIRPRPIAFPTGPILAVLAFGNQSSDPGLEYFAEGVSEDVLQAIARIREVRVIAKTSSFQITGENRQTNKVAAALGVTHILDGSIRRQGEQLRIVTQLVDVASETILWSHRFDSDLSNLFEVQDSIATEVAAALRLNILPKPQRTPVSSEALDLFLRGRRLAALTDTRQEGIACYEAALAIAPHYAEAWSSLALARAIAARWDRRTISFDEQSAAARVAAAQALTLDPLVGPARAALGVLEPLANYAARERYLLDALSLGLSDPETFRGYAMFTYGVGRVGEAFDYAERSWRIDPLNEMAVELYANFLFELGWAEESFAMFAKARERWSGSWMFHSDPIFLAASARNWTLVDALLAEAGADRTELAAARYFAEAMRNPNEAHRTAALSLAAERLEKRGAVDPSILIFLYELGLHDETFSMVDRSHYHQLFVPDGRYQDQIGFLLGIIFGVSNNAMRRDPRFITLCGKLGLCSYWLETGQWPDCADHVSDSYDFRDAAAAFQRDRQLH